MGAHANFYLLLDTGVTGQNFPQSVFPCGKNGLAHSFPREKNDRRVKQTFTLAQITFIQLWTFFKIVN